jgi:hypothetical protein
MQSKNKEQTQDRPNCYPRQLRKKNKDFQKGKEWQCSTVN